MKHTVAVISMFGLLLINCQREVNSNKQSDKILKNLLSDTNINLDFFVQEYRKVCPDTDVCKNNTVEIPESLFDSCPGCSCRPDCILNNECCPSVIYGYLEYECVNVVQRERNKLKNTSSYLMIASCPETLKKSNFSQLNTNVPVTSTDTGVTYKSQYFASCNDDDVSLVKWNTTVHCETWDDQWNPIQIYNFEDLIQYIRDFSCEIRFSITDTNVPFPAPCSGVQYFVKKKFFKEKNLIKSCNVTGLWNDFDNAIDMACRRLNLHYRNYKNVFCFICNPGLFYKYRQMTPVIRECSLFDNGSTSYFDNDCSHRFYAFSENLYDTWVHIVDLKDEAVAKVIGQLFEGNLEDTGGNMSYIDIGIKLNTSFYGKINQCYVPLHIQESTLHCGNINADCYTVSGENITHDEQYACNQKYNSNDFRTHNCSGVFRENFVAKEEFLLAYILELFLCHNYVDTVEGCNTVIEDQSCPLILSDGHTKKPLSCVLCKTGDPYSPYESYRHYGFNIIMNISCSNLLEEWLFDNIFSLLEVARRECSITFIPTGILNEDYNSIYSGRDTCIDFPFIDQITCEDLNGRYFFGSYRKLFSLPGDDWTILLDVERRLPPEVGRCAAIFSSSENQSNDSCRQVLCSDGHVLVNDSCKSEYETYGNILYEISYDFVVRNMRDLPGPRGEGCVYGDKQAIINAGDICKDVERFLGDKIGEKNKYRFKNCTLVSDTECSNDFEVEISVGTQLEVSLHIMIEFTKELTNVENCLVDSLSQNIAIDSCYIRLDLTPLTRHPSYQIMPKCVYGSYDTIDTAFVSKLIPVNKFLTCPQIELLGEEYIINNETNALEFTDKDIPPTSYITEEGRVRVCLHDFYAHLKVARSVSLLQRVYNMVDNICTILSLLCLIVTFLTYCFFSSLRTIPGFNNMNLILSLFCAQLTLKLGIWQPTDSIMCSIFGILIHFFWLATFCSMNVCSFHMVRVFTSSGHVHSLYSWRTVVLYLVYTYGLPSVIILASVLSHLTISDGIAFGYGKTVCFLTNELTAIVAFIFPCVLIFFTNIVFFARTFLSLRKTLNDSLLRRSVERRDYFIYMRLWTLLGVTWPLLIIDAMLEMSAFSFIALTFNTLQGVLIFISFVCNKRVLTLYTNCLTGEQSSSVHAAS